MNILLKLKQLPFKLWLTLTLFFLILAIFGIITILLIWYLASQLVNSYGIIIDAGSTSTKVYLYSWPEIASRTNAEVSEVGSCRCSPGISAFDNNVDKVYINIKYCLEKKLLPKIPKRLRKKSFLYLGATAGMRLLQEVNPNVTVEIFKALEKYLLTTELRFNKSLNDIQIISGVVEGLGAWISVNYLKGTLQNSKLSTLLFENKRQTYGALDLGGASTQIAFETDNYGNKTKHSNIRLYGYNYSVYSRSYLCFGLKQIKYRHLAHLLHDAKVNITKYNQSILSLTNPCMLKSDSFVYSLNEIITDRCNFGKYAIKTFGNELNIPFHLHKKLIKISFQGSGEVEKCQHYIDLLFSRKRCGTGNCSLNNIFRNNLTNRFLAFSGFNLAHSLLRKNSEKDLDFFEYQKRSNEYCRETAPVINESVLWNKKSEIYRKWKCFDVLYVFNLLKMFGFNENNWKLITFIYEVNNAKLGWALGYMINKTTLVPIEPPLVSMGLGTFLGLLIIFLIILSLGLLFAFFTIRRQQSLNSQRFQLKYTSLQSQKFPEEITTCKT